MAEQSILSKGLKIGTLMAGATLGTMVLASSIERRSPWSGFNAMANAIGYGRLRTPDTFDSKRTLAGVALLAGGLVAWGLAYEETYSLAKRRPALVGGVLAGLLGYAFDAIVLPKEVRRGFRRKMGLPGMIAKYVTLGVATALATATVEGEGAVLEPELPHRTTLPYGVTYEA